jgi:PEP-CTERM motif
MAMTVAVLIAGACWQNAARFLSLPSLHASRVLPDSFKLRSNVHKDLAFMAARAARINKVIGRNTGVYPYSIVPGGIRNSDALRAAAATDYVVRRHYANFDFNRARLVRAAEAREVYLSYRIRDRIFWTHHKVRLHLGELLLTDGNITARARCGNQISDTAKPEVSDEEPDGDTLDQPVAEIMPAAFVARPMLEPPDLPAGAPTAPRLFASGFSFPYIPSGVPISGSCPADGIVSSKKCPPKHHKPPVVPEPSTMVLLGSGIVLITWRYRKIARPIAA